MSTPCKVLLLADRDDDAHYLRRAIVQSPSLVLVHRAKNAKEVVSYLQGAGVYAEREQFPLPNVLILDLEMPNEDGFQVLEWLKCSDLSDNIRTIALAARDHPTYLPRASALGARCCLVKPKRDAALRDFTRHLEHWCQSAPPAGSLN